MSDKEKLYTIPEAIEYLHLKRRSFHRYLAANMISHIRPNGRVARGSKILFRKEHLDDFLKAQEWPSVYQLLREIHAVIVKGEREKDAGC